MSCDQCMSPGNQYPQLDKARFLWSRKLPPVPFQSLPNFFRQHCSEVYRHWLALPVGELHKQKRTHCVLGIWSLSLTVSLRSVHSAALVVRSCKFPGSFSRFPLVEIWCFKHLVVCLLWTYIPARVIGRCTLSFTEKLPKCSPGQVHHLRTSNLREFQWLHILAKIWCHHFNRSHSDGYTEVSHYGFVCKNFIEGRLGDAVDCPSDTWFSSGHDLGVVGLSPTSGSTLDVEPAQESLSAPPSSKN